MALVKNEGETYAVRDRDCIGRDCLKIHAVAIRGNTSHGSRTAGYINCCAQREKFGCPYPVPAHDKTLAASRKQAGMTVSRR